MYRSTTGDLATSLLSVDNVIFFVFVTTLILFVFILTGGDLS